MRPTRPDPVLLVAGLGVLLLGVLFLADAQGEVDLRFALLGPLVLGTLGGILLASGLSRRE